MLRKYVFLVHFTFTPGNLSLNKPTPPAMSFCASEQIQISFVAGMGMSGGAV